jgi:hypothetical protein
MANAKKTQREFYNEIIEVLGTVDRPDLIEFIEGRIEVLDRKKNGSSKPTATQIANEALKETVLAVITDEGATVSEIMAKSEELSGYSNQKISAILKLLDKDEKVTKVVEGKKSLFKVA